MDIGCGNRPYQNLFPQVDSYVGIDRQNPEADVIAQASRLPIRSDSIDVVLCNQVIEHDPRPDQILAEIFRILKTGGLLILSAPQMGRLHGEPEDYYRFTKWGLNYLLTHEGFEIEVMEPHGGIFRALGSHLNFFLMDRVGNRRRMGAALRYTLINLNNLLFRILDRFIPWEKDTLGYNILAKKRGNGDGRTRASG